MSAPYAAAPTFRRAALPQACLGAALMLLAGGALHAEDLDDVMHAALRTSLTIRADDARQRAASYALKGSIDAFMPTVSWVQERTLDSKIHYSPELPTLAANLDTYPRNEPNLHGIQISLPLFDGLKRFNTVRAEGDLFDAGQQIQVGVRQQVLQDSAIATLTLARDRRVVELRRSYVKHLGTIERNIEARYSVRDATITDLALARSRRLQAQAELDQSLSDLTTSGISYTRLSGLEPGVVAPVRVPDDLVPATPEELRVTLLRANPKLQAARLEASAAGHRASAAKSAILPQLNLAMQHVMEDNVSPAERHIRDTTVKLQLRVPIYEPGAFPRIGQAAAEAEEKTYAFQDQQRQAEADARALFFQRRSTIVEIASAQKRVAAIEVAVHGYDVELAAGYRTIVDTLNARAELTAARIALLDLELARNKQTFTLVAALARLDPEASQTPRQVSDGRR